jgi:hypothetical protein
MVVKRNKAQSEVIQSDRAMAHDWVSYALAHDWVSYASTHELSEKLAKLFAKHRVAQEGYWKQRFEELSAEFAILSRACGNWRTWPNEVESDHEHPDWKVAAKAIIERNALVGAQSEAGRKTLWASEEQMKVIWTYWNLVAEKFVGDERLWPCIEVIAQVMFRQGEQ